MTNAPRLRLSTRGIDPFAGRAYKRPEGVEGPSSLQVPATPWSVLQSGTVTAGHSGSTNASTRAVTSATTSSAARSKRIAFRAFQSRLFS